MGFFRNRHYTSQSGYRLSETLPDIRTLPRVALPPLERNLWTNLWKVKTSPKIRHFLWKALAGVLAVADRLRSRGIHIDSVCSSCGLEEETICHVLLNCHIARDTRNLSQILPPSSDYSQKLCVIELPPYLINWYIERLS